MSVSYIPALRLYIRSCAEKARGGVVSVRIRDVCAGDKRCEYVLAAVMKDLINKGVAQRRKQGVCLIDRSALGI
jgi:hypothetical protein